MSNVKIKNSWKYIYIWVFYIVIIVLNCIFSSIFIVGCFVYSNFLVICMFNSLFIVGFFVYSNFLVSCFFLLFIDFFCWRYRIFNGGGWIWNRGVKGKDKDKGKGKKLWFRNFEICLNWYLCYINDYMYCIIGYFMRERIFFMGVEFCIMFYFYL